jgi:hypothetical protein
VAPSPFRIMICARLPQSPVVLQKLAVLPYTDKVNLQMAP